MIGLRLEGKIHLVYNSPDNSVEKGRKDIAKNFVLFSVNSRVKEECKFCCALIES